jgi:hypothetical protein
MRKPTRGSPSSHVGDIIFFFVIMISLMNFANLAHNARSRNTRGSPSRISNFFERCANSIIHNLEAFFLPAHREHVGGLASQIEQSIAHAQESFLEAAADSLKLHKLGCLESVLALLAATFCGDKPRALLGEPVTGGTSATSGDGAQVRQNLATHLVEIIFAGRLPSDHALSEVLIKLRARAANVSCRLSYCRHFSY